MTLRKDALDMKLRLQIESRVSLSVCWSTAPRAAGTLGALVGRDHSFVITYVSWSHLQLKIPSYSPVCRAMA